MNENSLLVSMTFVGNELPDSACNRNISGLSFGTFKNTSKILGEVTMVTNGGAQTESGI
jgi:hypothetical protein